MIILTAQNDKVTIFIHRDGISSLKKMIISKRWSGHLIYNMKCRYKKFVWRYYISNICCYFWLPDRWLEIRLQDNRPYKTLNNGSPRLQLVKSPWFHRIDRNMEKNDNYLVSYDFIRIELQSLDKLHNRDIIST